jgi:nucleotide-binding universal stress UspA family protein
MRLAEQHGALCEVIHVVDNAMPREITERLSADAGARLRRFVDANKGDAKAQSAVLVGDPMEVIPAEAKARGADLVVLGLHRPRGFLDRLRETTMERLVRLLRTPVLLVREPADHDYENVLVPVSFSPACASALAAARRVAPDAALSVFHAVYLPFTGLTGEKPGGAMDRELTQEARAVMADWRRKEDVADIEGDIAIITGPLEDVLGRKLGEVKPDLIALGAHTRGPLATSVLGSFAADMIRQPPTDLLLAHP